MLGGLEKVGAKQGSSAKQIETDAIVEKLAGRFGNMEVRHTERMDNIYVRHDNTEATFAKGRKNQKNRIGGLKIQQDELKIQQDELKIQQDDDRKKSAARADFEREKRTAIAAILSD